MTPRICCTGTPVTLPDGRLQYRCGHVWRILLRVRGEEPVKKPVQTVKAKGAKVA
jgi:hypothetical protein